MHVLRLVTIDLSDADVALFERYEAIVLGLLGQYGARLEARVRSVDGRSETHLLRFPHAAAYAAFLEDPERAAARPLMAQSRARAESLEVVEVG